ncbi:MAG TPA: DUF4390 domain-containing protein [Gammaproteobacteria bacterium]|nr:DUF4390 domain-containing protein [Gammaproteobacteria bacterium]HET7587337.1 DUF4390 domain-containing protein [Gammaproteobacteria bacterium]
MTNSIRWARMGAVMLVLAMLAPLPVRAQDGGRFAIRSAYSVLRHGVYYLNANMALMLNQQAADALDSGVPLVLKIQIELSRRRSMLWDPTVATLTQSYRITYHALSRRYIVRSLNSGRQVSYRSWQVALEHLGDISGVPIIDASLLEPDEHYDIHIRALLNVKIIPTGFGLLTSLFYGADQSSDWYQWPLR